MGRLGAIVWHGLLKRQGAGRAHRLLTSNVEREKGFEPSASSLARTRSTTELLPHGVVPARRSHMVPPDWHRRGWNVPRVRIELTTPAFSVLCSTN